jgi:hypothetical protein
MIGCIKSFPNTSNVASKEKWVACIFFGDKNDTCIIRVKHIVVKKPDRKS